MSGVKRVFGLERGLGFERTNPTAKGLREPINMHPLHRGRAKTNNVKNSKMFNSKTF